MKKLSIRLLLCISLLQLFNGCISSNLENCPFELSVRFVYEKNPSGTDLLSNVQKLNVYIYDKQGNFVRGEHHSPSDLESGNLLRLQLDGGRYTLVTWADNDPLHYNTYYNTNLSSMHLELLAPGGDVLTPPTVIYHGLAETQTNKGMPQECTVSLMHNTHTVKVALKVPASLSPVAIGDYTMRITGSNGDYNYDNTLQGSRVLNYIQSYNLSAANLLESSSRVMRLFVGDDMSLDILDASGQVLQTTLNTNRLTEILMQSPKYRTQEALDRETDFLITCELKTDKDGNLIIEITGVNDWDLIENGGILS